MAIEILKATTGSRIIAVDTRDEALVLAKDCGADFTIAADAGVADEIRAVTGGRGADVVLDFVGSESTLAFGAAATRMLGDLTDCRHRWRHPSGFVLLSALRGVNPDNVLGEPSRIRSKSSTSRPGDCYVPVSRRLPWTPRTDAYRAMEEGELEGRAVVVPGQSLGQRTRGPSWAPNRPIEIARRSVASHVVVFAGDLTVTRPILGPALRERGAAGTILAS